MWKGYSRALIDYIRAINDECNHRGIKEAVWTQLKVDFGHYFDDPIIKPSWIGISAFHASHRSNLLRKDEKWYRAMGWTDPTDLPYYWPR
jgi:hypothetical protein